MMLIALSSLALAAPSPAGPLGLGVGGGFGVSGLSAKYYMGQGTALQAQFGLWGMGRDVGGFGLGVDYLFEQPALNGGSGFTVGWNYGVGASAVSFDKNYGGGGLGVGASGILGLEFIFSPIPVDLVLEYRPGVGIIPTFGLDLVNFSGHLRYYF